MQWDEYFRKRSIVKVENESLKNQISLFEDKIQLLQKGLEQTQSESNSRGNQEEIDKLQKQIKQIEEEKNQTDRGREKSKFRRPEKVIKITMAQSNSVR